MARARLGSRGSGRVPESRREEDRKTRRPLALWDRVKILILLLGVWFILVWYTMVQYQGIMPFVDALNQTARAQGWLLVLAGLEFVRQIHYIISEHWAAYYRFFTERLFGGWDRRLHRINDWNRFRIARALKWLLALVVLDLVVAQIVGVSPALALFQLPVLAFQALPFAIQLVFYFFIIIFQFVGLFWFLSRGGVDIYFPDDVKTRFTRRVGAGQRARPRSRRTWSSSRIPSRSRSSGGHVPGGVLLWGPPGTGKTLMAEAVAGETGKAVRVRRPRCVSSKCSWASASSRSSRCSGSYASLRCATAA